MHRNQLSALTRNITNLDANFESIEGMMSKAFDEYDEIVVENFKVCTKAFDKVILKYQTEYSSKLTDLGLEMDRKFKEWEVKKVELPEKS